MFDLLLYFPVYLDFERFEHLVLLSLIVSSFSHTVATSGVILQTSGLFSSNIRDSLTGSSGSITSVPEKLMCSVRFQGR